MSLSVLTICGSLRRDSFNAMLQRALPALAPEGMAIAPAPSFAGFPLLDMDLLHAAGVPPNVTALADAIEAADGVIFCSPEYNRTIPGGLKNAIDWISATSLRRFSGKPVALLSASPNPIGAARMQGDLRKVMAALDAFVLNADVTVGNCAAKFDAGTGALVDEATSDLLAQVLARFDRLIRATCRMQMEIDPAA